MESTQLLATLSHLEFDKGEEMQRIVSDEEVESRLAAFGVPREFIFLAPRHPERPDVGGILLIWDPLVGLRYVIIEKDELGKQCYFYLLSRGARCFATGSQAWQAAMDEKWLGWDTCADYKRLLPFLLEGGSK